MLSSNTSQVSDDVKYIEDVCSVYLRTGTGSSQTVTTGIKENTGALVISKSRSAATDWAWYDTFRGATYDLVSNSTAAQTTQAQGLTSFNADGHTWGTLAKVNTSGATYVDTVLKPTPKFFDVVTYTGNGATQDIPHNLGSVPGCILVKRTSSINDWQVYHRSIANTEYMVLNTTAAKATGTTRWNSTTPTDTVFSVGATSNTNASGNTYVAYIFAHDAGGFGLTGTDNVISCGSFTTDTSGNATINLGYEPQWLMIKRTNATGDWVMVDTMRGWAQENNQSVLKANLSDAEVANSSNLTNITATGMQSYLTYLGNTNTYIYIALRRGPMKVPTDATKVFAPIARTGTSAAATVTTGFPVDMVMIKNRPNTFGYGTLAYDKLRGALNYLFTNATDSEASAAGTVTGFTNTGFTLGNDGGTGYTNYSPSTYINWNFQRAPSFFDEVCYTGTETAGQTFSHNLGVTPELMIVKGRSVVQPWCVYNATSGNTKVLYLNTTDASATTTNIWNSTSPTSTVFTVGTNWGVNRSGQTYVAYLFATCAGVSKVGSYTGTGTTKQVDCGFAAGARFVLIKRTDSTGDWYVWDTARGIVSGNDPYLLLNSTAAEVTSTDYIDTYSAGFELSSTAPAALNASGGTYIFLAIA